MINKIRMFIIKLLIGKRSIMFNTNIKIDLRENTFEVNKGKSCIMVNSQIMSLNYHDFWEVNDDKRNNKKHLL